MIIKKIGIIALALLMIVSVAGCASQNNSDDSGSARQIEESKQIDETDDKKMISISSEDAYIIYELNDSTAARQLYDQLPLLVEVDDFSTNEKIFYPSQELDTSDSPAAEGGAGTLAYYAPWGDVVMFYDDYSANSSLFELGQAVSGGEQIGEMSGTIVIDIIDTADTEEYYTLIR